MTIEKALGYEDKARALNSYSLKTQAAVALLYSASTLRENKSEQGQVEPVSTQTGLPKSTTLEALPLEVVARIAGFVLGDPTTAQRAKAKPDVLGDRRASPS